MISLLRRILSCIFVQRFKSCLLEKCFVLYSISFLSWSFWFFAYLAWLNRMPSYQLSTSFSSRYSSVICTFSLPPLVTCSSFFLAWVGLQSHFYSSYSYKALVSASCLLMNPPVNFTHWISVKILEEISIELLAKKLSPVSWSVFYLLVSYWSFLVNQI